MAEGHDKSYLHGASGILFFISKQLNQKLDGFEISTPRTTKNLRREKKNHFFSLLLHPPKLLQI
jgi:hypothetical protein